MKCKIKNAKLKILKYSLYLLLTSYFSLLTCYAGTNPSAFINIGVGARALALGSAYVSIADDTTASYWNPAGLALLNKFSITAMGQTLGSTKWETLKQILPSYQFIAVAIPLKKASIVGTNNTIAVSWINNSLSNIPYTSADAFTGKILRDTFENYENAYFVSYGCSLLPTEDKLLVGTTLKYITQQFTKITDANAVGYDLDFGLIYAVRKLSLGLVLQRGVELTWSNGHRDLGSLTTKFGVSNKFHLMNLYTYILATTDFIQRKNQPVFAHFGSEFGYEPKKLGLYFRVGVDGVAIENRFGYQSKINNNFNWTAGVGIKIRSFGPEGKVQFDYAFGSYRLGDKNRFSINMSF